MRIIVSSRVRSLLESFRQENIRYYPCPVLRGKEMIKDYWITDKVVFDDDWVDFGRSEFFLRKRKLISQGNEPRARYEVAEQITQYKDLEDFNRYLRELKNDLQKQKMDKGIEFKLLEIPDEEWGGPNGIRKQFYN
jgi:hypothetical protein